MINTDQVVFEVQEYLRNISKVNPNITRIIPDGIYGNKTTDAVNDFQRQHSIEQTGKVDFETWQKLISENEKALFQLSKPIQTAPISNNDLPLEKGDRNEFVSQLKLMLNHVAREFSNFNELDIDEYYDDYTEREVTKWQKVINEPETGVVNKMTWNMLSEYYLLKEEKE